MKKNSHIEGRCLDVLRRLDPVREDDGGRDLGRLIVGRAHDDGADRAAAGQAGDAVLAHRHLQD